MTTSGGGGFCDCGDAEAWKKGPYCQKHTPAADNRDAEEVRWPPVSLTLFHSGQSRISSVNLQGLNTAAGFHVRVVSEFKMLRAHSDLEGL